VDNAYWGLSAQGRTDSVARIDINNSTFRGNQLGSVRLRHVRALVQGSEFTYRGSPRPFYGLLCDSLVGAESIRVQSTRVSGKVQLYGVACSDCRGTGPSALNGVVVEGESTTTVNAGIYLNNTNESLAVVSCQVLKHRGQAGLKAISSQSPVTQTTLWADTMVRGIVGMDFVGSTGEVRRCNVGGWRFGVRCDGGPVGGFCDVPDLGTESDSGNSSIAFNDSLCALNLSTDPNDVLSAQNNWWDKDTASRWFVGDVVWIPYLPDKPSGDGGQSAAVIGSRLVTELYAPAPNPASRQAQISYQVGTSGPVALRIHDLTGRVVRTLASSFQNPGRYAVAWDRRDDGGRLTAEGVYFIRLYSPGVQRIQKIVLTQ